MITQFAHRTISFDNSARSLLSLSILLTCLYSGDEAQLRGDSAGEHEDSVSADQLSAPVNNMERVKLLFDRIRIVGQLSNEAKIMIE